MILFNKNIKITVFIFLMPALFACNLFKKNIKKNENTNEKKIIQIQNQINKANLKFNTFSAGFSGSYKDTKQQFPLKGIIKIKKDSFIWITIRPFLGIEIARILITENNIKYIDKIKNQYFEENFDYLHKKFGFSITYELIEALLTNKLISYPRNEKLTNYILKKNNQNFIFQNKTMIKEYSVKHLLVINYKYKLIQNQLLLTDNSKSITINYEKFTEINTKQFPLKLTIKTINNKTKKNILLNLKNIKTDEKLNAKFLIPNNYKRIKID